jgi:hypothetical protein
VSPTITTSAGEPPRTVADLIIPSTRAPIRTHSATASRFQAGMNACILNRFGCDWKRIEATCRISSAGAPNMRRESRMCAVTTAGESCDTATAPDSEPSFHRPKTRE